MPMIVEFQGENRWLSNFATADVEYQGLTYPSVEHAWIASKTEDENIRKTFTNPGLHPATVKKLGASITPSQYWKANKVGIMRELLISKYSKDPFKTTLINTANDYIQEGNWWGDTFWGFCLERKEGENVLGGLIMEIRYELINAED